MKLSRFNPTNKTAANDPFPGPNAKPQAGSLRQSQADLEKQPQNDEFVKSNTKKKVLIGLGIAAAAIGTALLIYMTKGKKTLQTKGTQGTDLKPTEIVEDIINGTKERATIGGRKIIDEFVDGEKVKTTLHRLDGSVSNIVEFKDGKVLTGIFVHDNGRNIYQVKNYENGKIKNKIQTLFEEYRNKLGVKKLRPLQADSIITEYKNSKPTRILELSHDGELRTLSELGDEYSFIRQGGKTTKRRLANKAYYHHSPLTTNINGVVSTPPGSVVKYTHDIPKLDTNGKCIGIDGTIYRGDLNEHRMFREIDKASVNGALTDELLDIRLNKAIAKEEKLKQYTDLFSTKFGLTDEVKNAGFKRYNLQDYMPQNLAMSEGKQWILPHS